MSEFHLEQGFRDIYGGDGDLHRPVSITGSPTSIPSPGTQYKMGQPTYRSGVYVQRDVTLPPRPAATFIRAVDPAYAVPQRTQVVYRVHDNYNTSPTRDSPPPPPYSPPRNSPTRVLTIHSNNEYQRRSGSPSGTYAAVYKTETAALPRDNRGYPKRSSSPFQERNDVETLIPTYTAPYHPTENYPAGAPSKIVYSTHLALQGKGQVSSKPTSERDESDPKQFPPAPVIASSNAFSYSQSAATTPAQGQAYKAGPRSDSTPRPYQLKPTMGAYEDGKPVGQDSPKGPAKEAEVDALTNLLIQNMEVSGDPDFYGMCVKCGRAIMGDNSGCSALDQLFHIECFTCVTCEKCLKGHQFFAMEGKPYCEPCYMNTLEKCSVCSSPITDRILRATGKPYHPACFMCVVCGKSLDGVQFTVDATNQIHCIEDFHKKFAPRCCVCNDPVMPEPGEEETVRIVAMDRSFHIKCYKCEDCGLHLSSEADGRGCYPLDDHILCKQCNAKRIQAMTTRMMTEL